ncbi:glycosyltransferase family 4 protein [Candidatus Poriferisocius sp.]|uniref:glycosyltransferase family 4 protein n=1 Tax=Candidatus Poriferisocius sp. TaxID=3101276 RepID=UPI003B01EA58
MMDSTGLENHTVSVGVNLLWLRPGQVGGSEDYAVRLLSAIPPDDPVRLTLFAPRGFARAHRGLAERHEVVTPRVGRLRPLRVLAENTWLAAQCRRRNLDLVHHFGGTVPFVGVKPAVVTVHDLQPLDHPKRFGLVKRLYLRVMLPWSVRRAETIVTVSEFCRSRLVERLKVDPQRVAVVPAPVDTSSADSDMPLAAAAPDLASPFVLYPALSYPHKNHEVLLRALARLAADGVDVALVASGGPGPLDSKLDHLADKLGVGGRWHRLGRIPRAVLDGLYRQAVALVFPSKYEGYGLPVVEAMARGCPVVAADAGALPEVVGSGGRLVDADDAELWAEAIAELVGDSDARQALSEAGASRVGQLVDLDPGAELCALYGQMAAR